MSVMKRDSFVPYKNIKIKLYNNENRDTISDKNIKNNEFKYMYDNRFLQKQNNVLDIIEELREFDSKNGTELFKNILYLNLYSLLYK